MKENLKEKYNYAYDEGWRKSEELYSKSYSREHGFNYAQKCCRFALEAEQDAYILGFMTGWEDEESHDYKICSEVKIEEEWNS